MIRIDVYHAVEIRLWKARRLTVVHGEEVAAGSPAAARKLERESGVGFL
jgi:hypothetical protein